MGWWHEPATKASRDAAAATRMNDFHIGWSVYSGSVKAVVDMVFETQLLHYLCRQVLTVHALSGQVHASSGVWGLPSGHEEEGGRTVAVLNSRAVEELVRII